MSDYSRLYDFSAKDALATGDANKLIKGSEVDGEFDAAVTAIATKYDSADLASQAQGEAGTLNTVLMTPLRVEQWKTNWITEAITFSGIVTMGSGNLWTTNASGGNLYLEDSDRGSDENLWRVFSKDSLLTFATRTDANGIGNNAMVFRRTGTTVDEVEINATTLDFNGTLDVDGGAHNISDGTAAVSMNGSGVLSIVSSSVINMQDGTLLRIWDSGDTDYVQFSHDGTDFNIDGSNTASINFTGVSLNFGSASLTTANDTADEPGYKGMPQSAHTAASSYPIVLADAGNQIHLSASATGATIPANASVAFPLGTVMTIINQTGGDVTVSITTDTLTWSPPGTAGSRTLADNGMATITKVATTEWFIAGTGLT